MKTIIIIFFALTLKIIAEMPYLEMSGVATNPNQKVAFSREPVKDIDDAIKKMEITYTNKFANQTITASYHGCMHGPNNDSCVPVVLKVFIGGVKPDMSKYIEMKSSETNRYALSTEFILSVVDKVSADKIEAAVKVEYPDKTFEVDEKTSVEAK